MKWQTEVEWEVPAFKIDVNDSILLLGTCFTERIGKKIEDGLWSVLYNPFGVLYNPISILQSIDMLLFEKDIQPYLFQASDKLWYSWLHSHDFYFPTQEDCYYELTKQLSDNRVFFSNIKWLFITLGTNHIYKLNESLIVSNCHKQPHTLFKEEEMSVTQIVELWQKTLSTLFEQKKDLKVVFTLSPYRYLKYGLPQNQVSKSTLLLAIYEIIKIFPHACFYFPAYEIVNDELRDYRFYEADMLHPTKQASDYIWQRLLTTLFTEKAQAYIQKGTSITTALNHKPLRPNTKEFQFFLMGVEQKLRLFQKEYPCAPIAMYLQNIATKLKVFQDGQQ